MRQLSKPVHPASGLESVIETVPEPLGPLVVAVIVAVLAKLAVSVSVLEALKVQGLVVPVQVPPDQPVNRLPVRGGRCDRDRVAGVGDAVRDVGAAGE